MPTTGTQQRLEGSTMMRIDVTLTRSWVQGRDEGR